MSMEKVRRTLALAAEARAEGNYRRAIELYSKLLAHFETSVLYNQRGITYTDLGELKAAVADLNKAVALDGNDPECRVNRGNALLLNGCLDEAIEDFTAALSLAPETFQAANSRGVAFRRQAKFDLAEQDFESAIKMNLVYESAYLNLAELIASDRHDPRRAIKVLTEGSQRISNSNRLRRAIEKIKLEEDDYE